MHRANAKTKTQSQKPAPSESRPAPREPVKSGVTYTIPTGLHYRLQEEAQAAGRTAAALMTELLESAMTERLRVRYPILRPAAPTADSSARTCLYERYASRLVVNPLLTRKLVSFQASKTTPFYRWLKYKEAFSPELVDYL
jgi:hypothetical protein